MTKNSVITVVCFNSCDYNTEIKKESIHVNTKIKKYLNFYFFVHKKI